MSEHYDIICPECRKRIGGCRCIGEPRTQRVADRPCEVCQAVKHLASLPQGAPSPAPAGALYCQTCKTWTAGMMDFTAIGPHAGHDIGVPEGHPLASPAPAGDRPALFVSPTQYGPVRVEYPKGLGNAGAAACLREMAAIVENGPEIVKSAPASPGTVPTGWTDRALAFLEESPCECDKSTGHICDRCSLLKGAPGTVQAPAAGPHECSWTETARDFCNGMELYRNLLDECAKHLGKAAYTSDDGSVQDEPVRLKIPELVAALAGAPSAGRPADLTPWEFQEIAARMSVAECAVALARAMRRVKHNHCHINGLRAELLEDIGAACAACKRGWGLHYAGCRDFQPPPIREAKADPAQGTGEG